MSLWQRTHAIAMCMNIRAVGSEAPRRKHCSRRHPSLPQPFSTQAPGPKCTWVPPSGPSRSPDYLGPGKGADFRALLLCIPGPSGKPWVSSAEEKTELRLCPCHRCRGLQPLPNEPDFPSHPASEPFQSIPQSACLNAGGIWLCTSVMEVTNSNTANYRSRLERILI